MPRMRAAVGSRRDGSAMVEDASGTGSRFASRRQPRTGPRRAQQAPCSAARRTAPQRRPTPPTTTGPTDRLSGTTAGFWAPIGIRCENNADRVSAHYGLKRPDRIFAHYQLTMVREVGRRGDGAAHAASGATGELSSRCRRAVDERSDLLEREIEHVVHNEGHRPRPQRAIAVTVLFVVNIAPA
jgi:hypothetical protein